MSDNLQKLQKMLKGVSSAQALEALDRAFELGLLVKPYELDESGRVSVQLAGEVKPIQMWLTFSTESGA